MARRNLCFIVLSLAVLIFVFRWGWGRWMERLAAEEATKIDIEEFLAMARNGAIDADVREKSIMELGRRGGPDAISKLMALGNADTYFNFAAVNALATLPTPAVAAYLEAKCFHADPRMVSAAVSSLAKVEGAAAVPKIADVLERNRIRDDGFQDLICAQCVNTLKELDVSSALPVLVLELEKTVGVSLQYEYGSAVVSAMGKIGDPAGLAALEAYAERLKALKVRPSNPEMGVQYFQSKIDEVEGTMNQLRSRQFPD